MTVLSTALSVICDSFSQMNVFCRKVTQASRVCRSIEMIVQARWIVSISGSIKLEAYTDTIQELFENQIQHRSQMKPELSTTKHRKAVFMEACQDFGWSEYVYSPVHQGACLASPWSSSDYSWSTSFTSKSYEEL
jgi:ATP-dependent RNA helicase DDX49/DBP8